MCVGIGIGRTGYESMSIFASFFHYMYGSKGSQEALEFTVEIVIVIDIDIHLI